MIWEAQGVGFGKWTREAGAILNEIKPKWGPSTCPARPRGLGAFSAGMGWPHETERQLCYVACTRARDRLLVSGIAPGSEFVSDLRDSWG